MHRTVMSNSQQDRDSLTKCCLETSSQLTTISCTCKYKGCGLVFNYNNSVNDHLDSDDCFACLEVRGHCCSCCLAEIAMELGAGTFS